MEEWRPIAGYPSFEASSKGNIRYADTKLPVKEYLIHSSYKIISLHKDKWGLVMNKATLVAKTFVPNPNNYRYVKHINYDTLDTRPENLIWVPAANGVLTEIEWPDGSKKIFATSKAAREYLNVSVGVYQYAILKRKQTNNFSKKIGCFIRRLRYDKRDMD